MTADAPAPAASLSTTLNKGNIILGALEQRENAAVPLTLELHPPPQPVPRRKRPFLLRRPPAAPPPPAEAPVVLDGFVLLETCRVEDPEEAERAVLEGCSISAVVGEDLPFFTRLTHLDLGDNAVQLEGLAYLPALQELHLDCNGLTDLACPPGGFPRLEVLNLSYNAVPPASLLALADLPKLRELDLSNNGLSALPADLSGFGALQRLNCDHNLLGSVSSWVALASLPRRRSRRPRSGARLRLWRARRRPRTFKREKLGRKRRPRPSLEHNALRPRRRRRASAWPPITRRGSKRRGSKRRASRRKHAKDARASTQRKRRGAEPTVLPARRPRRERARRGLRPRPKRGD